MAGVYSPPEAGDAAAGDEGGDAETYSGTPDPGNAPVVNPGDCPS